MMNYSQKRKMWRSVTGEARDLRKSVEHALREGEFCYKLAVEQSYAECLATGERTYLDLVHVSPERYDAKTLAHAPIKPTGWFPASFNIASFALHKNRKWGISYFEIVHGRTGNDTIGNNPVAIAFTKKGCRKELERILTETVEYVHDTSGCPIRDKSEPHGVAFSPLLLDRYE